MTMERWCCANLAATTPKRALIRLSAKIAAATGVQITPQPTAPAAVIEVLLAEETPEPSSSEPMPASTAAGGAASWELESSATGEALLLDEAGKPSA